jgi:hypothetical protein
MQPGRCCGALPAPSGTNRRLRAAEGVHLRRPRPAERPDVTTVTDSRLTGGWAIARAWNRLHPRPTRLAAWMGSTALALIEGAVIRLEVAGLPSGAIPRLAVLVPASPLTRQVDVLW